MIDKYLISRSMLYTPTYVARWSKYEPNGIFIPRNHHYIANNKRKKGKKK